ncbi:hypothetical protein C7M84_004950 [Penaeus vannamei]|uniref:Uncharacterized protein n=1 Tax=Penaeus vannamei TaxID=6689 RepID=A0A423TJ19_PENVA|nr:hypothetical protein C7M84_004950 [Penaeus vannamei]
MATSNGLGLKGKVAIITGATSGIGRGCAVDLARAVRGQVAVVQASGNLPRDGRWTAVHAAGSQMRHCVWVLAGRPIPQTRHNFEADSRWRKVEYQMFSVVSRRDH